MRWEGGQQLAMEGLADPTEEWDLPGADTSGWWYLRVSFVFEITSFLIFLS